MAFEDDVNDLLQPPAWNTADLRALLMQLYNIVQGGPTVLAEAIQAAFGDGLATGRPKLTLHADVSNAATPANTTETDLLSYALPAESLSGDGAYVDVKTSVLFAANGNNKSVKLYFGSTVIATLGPTAYNNVPAWIEARVFRTGSNTQRSQGIAAAHGVAPGVTIAAPAETDTGAITIKVTGQNGTASAGDVTVRGLFVEAGRP